MSLRNRRFFLVSLDCKMVVCDSDLVYSGDSLVFFCIGELFFGFLINLDGFGKICGGCINFFYNCFCYVCFEY